MSAKKVIGIALLVVLIPPLCLAFLFTIPYIVSYRQPDPPRPEITYGEFPFRIEYEINGELIIIEDSVICEFDGFFVSWGGDGKTRQWKVSFASGRKSEIFKSSAYLLIDEVDQICFSLGDGKYYMGDVERPYNQSLYAIKIIRGPGGSLRLPRIDSYELLNTYDIKIISYEISPPIVNSFK